MKVRTQFIALVLSFLSTQFSFAIEIPILPNNLTCLDTNHEAMPYLNEDVMDWKKSTPDQTIKRALIHGSVVQIFPSKTGHTHFAIDIDEYQGGDIEVIYNDNFGELPRIKMGMKIVACGDYITVGPKAQRPSPMGAIIHWLHHNPGDRDGGKHKHGFLIIDGKPFGTR